MGWLPELVERERQKAAAARKSVVEHAEAAARLQVGLTSGLVRGDWRRASIAQR